MKVRNLIVTGLLVLTGSVFGQNISLSEKQMKVSYLDSIKGTFKHDSFASCVDSLWMKELTNPDLFADLSNDIKNINLDEKVDYDLSTELLKKRLKAMDEKSPFNIQYNPTLENIIKSFLKNRKKSYERLMAISEYYFPMFEEAMAKLNVPLEIKYLAVVESALNPKAVSRVGATGLWQFMYHTGKQYNLNIDSYVDERSDPLKASLAAAQYMSNMYKIFGDWELVLASYNSGPGNVAKAIRRSGGGQTFWDIRKNLPKETQGYVPAFLATMYIYEYHKEHGIVPNRAKLPHFATDTIRVRQQISFKQISDLLDISVSQLQLLNPHYKTNVVPFYKDSDHFLRLPSDKIAVFTSNEDKIYAYVNYDNNSKTRMFNMQTRLAQSRDSINEHVRRDRIAKAERLAKEKSEKPADSTTTVAYHKVKRGDNLSEIASKYGVTVSEIKKWNHLKSSSAPLGRNLKIVGVEESKVASNDKKESKAVAVKETKSESAEFYTVQKGDNLGAIAKKYNVSIADLKEWNNLENNGVNAEAKLRVSKPENAVAENKEKDSKESTKNATVYTVQKGEYLGTVAKKFGVTVAEIREWNNLENDNVNAGRKLTIQKADESKAKTEVAVNSKKDKHLKDMHEYVVRKGDSLFTIAKKFQGVTVSDIKKWNGISGDELKPGMKLKING